MSKISTYGTVTPTLTDKIIGTDISSSDATKNFTLQSIKDLFSTGGGLINAAEFTPSLTGGLNISNTGATKMYYVLLGSYVSLSVKIQFTVTQGNQLTTIYFNLPIASTFTDTYDAILSVDNPLYMNHASCNADLTTPSRIIVYASPQQAGTYVLSLSGFYKIR